MLADSTPAALSPRLGGESSPARSRRSTAGGPLTGEELYQLTLYKWRYSLEALGFAAGSVRSLMFLKWLHLSERLRS